MSGKMGKRTLASLSRPPAKKLKRGESVRKGRGSDLAITRRINTGPQIFYIVRRADKLVANGTGSTTYGSLTFSMNDVDGVSDFQGLFDCYRIEKIEYRWAVENSEIVKMDLTTGNYTSKITRVVFANDLDGGAAPGSVQNLYQEGKDCKDAVLDSSRPLSPWFTLMPRFSNIITLTGGTTTKAVGDRKMWLDCDQATIEHNGLRYAIQNNMTGQTVRLECKYHFCFKSVN